jgi:hypothetical protein
MEKAVYDGKGVICSTCKVKKEIDEFNKEKAGKYGIKRHCRECQHAAEKARYTSRTGSVKAKNQRLKTRYGITLSEYHSLVEAQQNACAICNTIPSKLYIDHDHTTNKLRALLCSQCNSLLGMAKENKQVLQAAIDYLSIHSTE